MARSNRTLVPAALLLLCIYGTQACVRSPADYRNFWLELSSTTLCGHAGGDALGVCALPATCSIMGGEGLGTYNCPLSRGTCCRPVASCNATSIAINLLWQSANYETASTMAPSKCVLRVVPSPDTCYIRVDFDDMDLQSNEVDKCGKSKLRIKGQEEGDGFDLCGTLNHKTTFLKVAMNMVRIRRPIDLELDMQHTPHKYSVRVNHIKCGDVKQFSKDRYVTAGSSRDAKVRSNKEEHKEPAYMARLFAVAYTDAPLIRSCPVTFISKDIVIGPASCGLRLGGPGTSKGLMVVHGASHMGGKASYPASVSAMAKYVAANGVVVKATTLHPMYNHITKENDIAIYFLNKTVFSAEPVTLSSKQESFLNLAVSISRYQYHDMAEDVTVLAEAEDRPTRVLKSQDCVNANLPKVSTISTNTTLCLAATQRDHLPCHSQNGDSGSPVIHVSSSGDITLIGMLMGGYHPCDGRKMDYPEPALSISDYLDFINVATSPSYKIPHADNSTIYATVVNFYESMMDRVRTYQTDQTVA